MSPEESFSKRKRGDLILFVEKKEGEE